MENDLKILTWALKEDNKDEAFKLLLKTYQKRIFFLVLRLVKQEADAKDVTQNVFIKVYKKLDTFKQDASLYTWLHRIATNESLNHLKSQKRKRTESLDSSGVPNQQANGSVEGETIKKVLMAALETLPERQKQVFELRYFDEMTYQEIVEILGGSIGSMKASYHHAVKKMEAYIRKQETF